MKDLTGKAESMMNVILLVSVLLAWACIESWNDPIEIGSRLYSALDKLPEHQRTESVRNFLTEVERKSGHERRDRVSQVSVKWAIAMHDDVELEKTDDPRALRQARALLRKLESMQTDAGVTNTVTFKEFHKRVAPPIKVPFIDQELSSLYAVLVLTIGLVGPFVFLLSLMSAIKAAIEKGDRSEGAGWLFFHPDKLGISLGIIWLFAPSITLLLSCCFVSIDRHLRLGCGLGLVVVACFAVVKVRGLRKMFFDEKKQPKSS
jgi:hypothetical protein